ncbi:MAG: hypothetical protein ACR2JP_03785 [Acidimicrobiia bacterium]
MTRRVVAILILVAGVAIGIGWWWRAASEAQSDNVVGSDLVIASTRPSLTPLPTPEASTTTTAADPSTTTSTIPPLPVEWYDRLWLTVPATDTSPTRSAPIIAVGPRHDPDREWNPDFGTVQVYQDDRLAMPCEFGAAFLLGHANFSSREGAWDFFYDIVNSERYANDSGLEVGQQLVVALEDGTEVCRYEVVDMVDGPGEHLATSPGRFFLKSDLSGEPDDPTGGPDDQLIQRAWRLEEPTMYLFGSYAGLTGDEMDATGIHQAYNFVVAVRLVDPAG